MARVISVCLPMWPIDRLQRQADSTPSAEAPLILVGRVGNRRVVTAACEAAMGLGLRIEQADPRADLEALERLGLWLLQRIAPIVAVDPPDGVVIDVTGADHLHGGEEALLEMLLGRLTLSGIPARLAIADTWGGAHLDRIHEDAEALAPDIVEDGQQGPEMTLPGALEPFPADWAAQRSMWRAGLH